MKFELGAEDLMPAEKKKTNLEIFKEVFEKNLLDLEKFGRFSTEEIEEKRKAAANFTEDQVSNDPAFIGEVFALSSLSKESKAPREKLTIDFARYKDIAHQLEEKHKDQMWIDGDDFIDGRRDDKTIAGLLRQFPREILEHYAGHGVRNSDNTLAATISILENNIFVGEVGHLVSGFEHCPAYTHGDLLIISHKNKSLMQKGTRGVSVKIGDKNMLGTRIDSGVAFVCNLTFDSLVDDLREMFPHIKILHANELADYINEEEKTNGVAEV